VGEGIDIFICICLLFLLDQLDCLIQSNRKQIKFSVFFDRCEKFSSLYIGTETSVIR
jgi:hypothetical protein